MSDPTQNLPPVPEKPTSARKKKRRGGLAVIVIVAILATVGLTAGGLYLGGVFATEIIAEPYDSPGIDPFGGSVGDGQSVPITPVAQIRSEAAVVPPSADPNQVTQPVPAAPVTTAAAPPADGAGSGPSASNTVTGETVGLYGGSQNNAVCDPPKLIAFLQANPDKARAWAAVELVPVDQIAAFVATLTPVILRTDTAVINHGFRDGVANPFNAVLQAGTAVLVDQYGVPRVRCKCGNPLLPPKRYNQVKYGGTRWLGFDERNITYIQRSPRPITQFRIVILCNCGYGPPPTAAIPFVPPGGGTPVVPPGQSTVTCAQFRDGTCVVPRPPGAGTPRRTPPGNVRNTPNVPDDGGGTPPDGGESPPDGGGTPPDGGGTPPDNDGPRAVPPDVPAG